MKFKFIVNILLLLVSGGFLGLGVIFLFYVFTPLPNIEIQNIDSRQSIILEDRSGEFLFDFSKNEKRTYIPIEDISENIINATIAIEDHLFFEHSGVRIDAFLRALFNNITTQSFSQGGSTITQQVIKNIFLTTEKKIERKMKEILLAWKIEKLLEKDKILELYLNTIPYGGVIYGIGEASNSFFGKKPSEITIAEAAYLAAIPNASTYFSPYGSHKTALENRKNRIISLMLEHGFISREEYTKAKNDKVHFQEESRFVIQAPHFVFFVKKQLEKEYGQRLSSLEGEKIRTTIDLQLQKTIEDILNEASIKFKEKHNGENLAAVVLATKTGEILSMVGSQGFFNDDIDGGVNIITSLRQPGSTFKPIVYAKAFEKGLRPETIVYDVATQFTIICDKDRFESAEKDNCYSPFNYTEKFVGPITLKSALAQSINIPAVKVLYLAGAGEVISLAKDMGITSFKKQPYEYGLSMALGSVEVTPIELAQAYSVFANDGLFIPNTWKLTDTKPSARRVIPQNVSRDITEILSDDRARAPIFGFRSPLYIENQQVAVKTGTTNNSRDAWVVGYSPDVIVLIWGGNSDGTILENNAAGFSLARPFRDIMIESLNRYGLKGSYFPRNTSTPEISQNIVNGIIDSDNHHSILHYIDRKNFKETPTDPATDPQYDHWEFGVQNWVSSNKEEVINRGVDTNVRYTERFLILTPPTETNLSLDDVVTVAATPITRETTEYEFYVNNKLIGSSHLPIFNFKPSQVIKDSSIEVTVRIIANNVLGVFSTERTYTLER